MLSVLVSLSLLCIGVYCNPDGAPVSACETMVPNHGVSAQTSNSPYMVTMNTSSYTAGDVIQSKSPRYV
jgi:hypothetical protein